MKYYKLRFVSSMSDGFGGKASMWKIKILNKYRNDKGLLEHEKWHVRCWYYCLAATWLAAAAVYACGPDGWWFPLLLLGPWTHGTLYRNKYFRKWSEIRAYRIQLKASSYHSPQFAIDALMHKYGLGMSERRARKALGLD